MIASKFEGMNFTVTENTNRYKKKFITIPNLLTFFRVCLIPLLVWLYLKGSLWATAVFLLSGLTDIVDGYVARKFDMVSDFGKAFDASADKLTQMAVLFCMVVNNWFLAIPLGVLVVKEILAATLNMITLKKTGDVMGAVWHGKITTILLYSTMLSHILWINIPTTVSNVMAVICVVSMLFSSVLYTRANIKAIKTANK